MNLSIAISPCPNDTFIFDAIYRQQIECSPYTFSFQFEDVETLNQMATQAQADIIKISYAHYFQVAEDYIMLQSGSAMGHGVGPILIANKTLNSQDITHARIATPGKHTTAYFLLKEAHPDIHQIEFAVFSDIEQKVLSGECDAGVIIHENRFTYSDKGLLKIEDLGETWEKKHKLPIPLGGIAIKRSLSSEVQQHIQDLITMSILHANMNRNQISDFIRSNAQEMDHSVLQQHIDLYVNEYSLHLGPSCIEAVTKMKELISPHLSLPLFVAQ